MNSHQPSGRWAADRTSWPQPGQTALRSVFATRVPPAVRHAAGFTLVEILSVMVIIVMLAALIMGGMGVAVRKAAVSRAWADMEKIKVALAETNLLTGSYYVGNSLPSWGFPNDPWGNSYQYCCPGAHNGASYDLWSYGPDRANGTADDLVNWQGR